MGRKRADEEREDRKHIATLKNARPLLKAVIQDLSLAVDGIGSRTSGKVDFIKTYDGLSTSMHNLSRAMRQIDKTDGGLKTVADALERAANRFDDVWVSLEDE